MGLEDWGWSLGAWHWRPGAGGWSWGSGWRRVLGLRQFLWMFVFLHPHRQMLCEGGRGNKGVGERERERGRVVPGGLEIEVCLLILVTCLLVIPLPAPGAHSTHRPHGRQASFHSNAHRLALALSDLNVMSVVCPFQPICF